MLVEILYKEIESTDQLLGVKNYRKANLGFVTEVGSLLHLKCLEDSGMKSKIEEGKFFWPQKIHSGQLEEFQRSVLGKVKGDQYENAGQCPGADQAWEVIHFGVADEKLGVWGDDRARPDGRLG
jgi:hypothetical protein